MSVYGNPTQPQVIKHPVPPCANCGRVFMAGVVKGLDGEWRCWFCAFPR